MERQFCLMPDLHMTVGILFVSVYGMFIVLSAFSSKFRMGWGVLWSAGCRPVSGRSTVVRAAGREW